MKKKLNCVLLVDDNESDNFIHKRVLEKSGIASHVEIAMNGQEALDFLITKGNCGQEENSYCQPELIFLDINMPVMDGWEFLEEYHKLEEAQKGKIVFIMLTTSLNPSDKAKAEAMIDGGCFQFKPLTIEMINTIIHKHFPEYI
ncbi:MAG: response regulator [Bacteroidota bacterium]